MKKCGIYIIKNKINDKVYIGQSIDINCRWYAHKQAALQPKNQSYNTKIHKAMREFGINNFYIEILEECEYNKLSEREIYYINFYNSCINGYNMTLGGESNKGETNGRALLTQEKVEDIRMAYNQHIPFKEVYEKYKNTISKRGLQKVWHYETWKHIMPEVYTEENRKWHATEAKSHIDGNTCLGKNNKMRACTEEEIKKMRELRKEGYSYNKISLLCGRSSSVVRKYCLFQENKNNNKIWNSKQIKNIETGLIFDSYSEAAKWSNCTANDIRKHINDNNGIGKIPYTDKFAHWSSL